MPDQRGFSQVRILDQLKLMKPPMASQARRLVGYEIRMAFLIGSWPPPFLPPSNAVSANVEEERKKDPVVGLSRQFLVQKRRRGLCSETFSYHIGKTGGPISQSLNGSLFQSEFFGVLQMPDLDPRSLVSERLGFARTMYKLPFPA
jgi:hypothetical protein